MLLDAGNSGGVVHSCAHQRGGRRARRWHRLRFAIGGAIVLALTLTPVLARRVLKIPAPTVRHPQRHRPIPATTALAEHEPDDWLMRALKKLAVRLLAAAQAGGRGRSSAAMMIASLATGSWLGRESCPSWRDFWMYRHRCRCRSSSSSRGGSYQRPGRRPGVPDADHCCNLFGPPSRPEITTVVSRLGAPDCGWTSGARPSADPCCPWSAHSTTWPRISMRCRPWRRQARLVVAGTFIRALSGDLFPTHIRAMVLDGALDRAPGPDLHQHQAGRRVRQRADRLLQHLTTTTGCPWRPTGGPGRFNALRRALRPALYGDGTRTSGGGRRLRNVVQPLYDQRRRGGRPCLGRADAGDGSVLLQI